jgi:hypothetical protein
MTLQQHKTTALELTFVLSYIIVIPLMLSMYYNHYHMIVISQNI